MLIENDMPTAVAVSWAAAQIADGSTTRGLTLQRSILVLGCTPRNTRHRRGAANAPEQQNVLFAPKEYYRKNNLVWHCCVLALQSLLPRRKHALIPLQFKWAQFV